MNKVANDRADLPVRALRNLSELNDSVVSTELASVEGPHQLKDHTCPVFLGDQHNDGELPQYDMWRH
jgi:hypothetical protein